MMTPPPNVDIDRPDPMFSRHAWVAKRPVPLPNSRSATVGDWTIRTGSELPLQVAPFLAIAGHVVDPDHPAGALDDVLEAFADSPPLEQAGMLIDRLAGRFLALMATREGVFLTQDGLGTKPIFSDAESGVAATAPGLLLQLTGRRRLDNPDLERLWTDPDFIASDYALGGVTCPHSGSRRILPNSWLGLDRGTILYRDVTRTGAPCSPEEVARRLTTIVRGLAAARPNLQLGLSGGRDSRLVLAAAIKSGVPFKSYSYTPPDTPAMVDAVLANEVAASVGVAHKVWELPRRLSPEITRTLEREQIRVRPTVKICEVEHRHRARDGSSPLYLIGNGGEFLRDHYEGLASARMARHYARLLERQGDPLLRELFDEWWRETYARRPGAFRWLDQYYWEQRLGVWGALGFSEHDAASDQISPFSSRAMIIDGIDRRVRMWHRCDRFHGALMEQLCPSLDKLRYTDQSVSTIRWLVKRPTASKVARRLVLRSVRPVLPHR